MGLVLRSDEPSPQVPRVGVPIGLFRGVRRITGAGLCATPEAGSDRTGLAAASGIVAAPVVIVYILP